MVVRDQRREGAGPLPALTTVRVGSSTPWGIGVFAVLSLLGCSPEVQIASGDAGATSGGAPVAGTGGVGAMTGGGSSGSGGTIADAGAGGTEDGGADQGPELRILADSVADFSLTQGVLGWYYGLDGGDVASFTQLTRQSIITAYKPPSGDMWRCWTTEAMHWTQLFQLGGHPNGTESSPPSEAVLERAVRRWVSNYAGHVVISGELAKIDVSPDDSTGIEGKILIDGVELYQKAIAADDGAGVAFGLEADLSIGSTVDFVIDPMGHDHHDLTRFTAVIAIAPEPR